MITIFTTPKPLEGHNLTTFLNVLGTWKCLDPEPEIIVFEESLPESVLDMGVRQVKEYPHNERGLPYANGLFSIAQEIATNDILMYANDDMIFLQNLIPAIQAVDDVFKYFLLVGRRWDLSLASLIDFADAAWEAKLRQRVEKKGELHSPAGMDYFVFRRPLPWGLPPMFVGRPRWDGWLLSHSWSTGMPIIDGTAGITAIHINHNYAHVPGGLHPNRTKLGEWKHNQKTFRQTGAKGDYAVLMTKVSWCKITPEGAMRRK